MKKEGGSIKTWKKRWFSLDPSGELTYYKSEGGAAMGSINVHEASSCGKTKYKKKGFCFEVVCKDRTYHIVGNSDEEIEDWIAKINEVRAAGPGTSSGGAGGGSTTVSKDDFETITVIGKGSFGKVLQVRHKESKKIYAMKVLNKASIIEKGELEHAKAEKSILKKLKHPFLVSLHFSFTTEDKLYFVMDYVNGGELFYILQKEKTFSEERVRFYAAEISLGLAYLHDQGVIYRDLKPENLLLSKDGHICMTDFGISKEGLEAKDARTATFCGTPEYLAPEVLEGKEYGKPIDWWSLGTVLYEMLCGLPPFYTEDVQLMYAKIMKAKLKLPDHLSEHAKSLIEGFLERDPDKRLADLDDIMKHPFFDGLDWDKLYNLEIEAPWKPKVDSLEDSSQIDPAWKAEVAESVADGSALSGTMQDQFKGFTYVGESGMGE